MDTVAAALSHMLGACLRENGSRIPHTCRRTAVRNVCNDKSLLLLCRELDRSSGIEFLRLVRGEEVPPPGAAEDHARPSCVEPYSDAPAGDLGEAATAAIAPCCL